MMNQGKKHAIRTDIPLSKIQGLRLAQALMESHYPVSIPEDDVYKLEYLKKFFPIEYRVNEQGAIHLADMSMCHKTPRVRVGAINRPLVFPHSAFNLCRSLWKESRDIEFFFAGLLTGSRRETLQNWGKRNLPENQRVMPSRVPFLSRLCSKILLKIGRNPEPIVHQATSSRLVIWSSDRGRVFPIKGWDDDYWRMLAGSRFVLCPNGDFVWTYRFFESIMCGAIPIIEDNCEHYDGFKFYRMSDAVADMKWTMEDAEHNYQLCFERLTIPTDQLNEELDRLVNTAAALADDRGADQ